MSLPLPTLIDLKAQLNYPADSSADDGELYGHLLAATDVVEGMVGPLSARTVTETHYRVATDILVLRQVPAGALTAVSVRAYPGTPDTAYLASDLLLDADLGFVRWADGRRWYGDVTVTYTAGLVSVPAAVSLAILIIAGHLWETQRGASPSTLQPDVAPFNTSAGFAIPNRASELLAPFRQVRVA